MSDGLSTIAGGGGYHAHSGVVRIWPKQSYDVASGTTFTNVSTQPAQSGWTASNLVFDVKLCDNTLQGSMFYIDPKANGASMNIFSPDKMDGDDQVVGDSAENLNAGCVLISGNTKIVKSTSVAGHDDICGFNVSRGYDWFGDDADTVESAVPSEPDREDAPFVVVRNTIIVVNDKSGTRRIVRGTQKGATQGGRIQTVTGLNPS